MMIRWSVFALLLPLLAMPIGGASARPDEWGSGTVFPDFGEDTEQMKRGRTSLDTYMDSSLYDIRVHYDYEDEDLMWLILEAAELSWEIEVDGFGWFPPVSDGERGGSDAIDYYIADSNQDPYLSGAGGYTTTDSYNDCDIFAGRAVCPAYLVINEEMPEYYIQETVAHEFNHALQYAMDVVEDRLLFEATASYTQGAVSGHAAAWGNAMEFQGQWYQPLDFFDYGGTAYQYGAFLFVQYLAERFGDGTPGATVEVWKYSTQSNYGNSKDWISGLEDYLEDNWVDDLPLPGDGESYVMVMWQDWSEWRFFLGPYTNSDYMTGGEPDTGSARLPFSDTIYFNEMAAGPVVKELSRNVGEQTNVALELEPVPAGTPVTIAFEDDGIDWKWSLTVIQLSDSKEVVELIKSPIEVGSIELSTTTLEDTHQVIALLSVLGDGHYHPNLDEWYQNPSWYHSGTWTVTAEGVELPEEELPPEDEDEGNCSCSADGTPAAAPLTGLALLTLLVLLRRR